MADDTRARIVVATSELFRRRGYHGTSLSAIGAAAGATTGSIYHFFPGGKEALAESVLIETGAAYRELFELIASEAVGDPVRAISNVFTGAGETLAAGDFVDICPIGTVAGEVASEHERLRVAADAVFASWVESVAAIVVAAGVAHDEAVILATTIVALIEGSFILARTRRDASVLEAAGAHASALVEMAVARTGV